jgi:hypothetical protein
MSFRRRSRPARRRPRCLNAGFGYGALAGLLFVVLKTLKYSGGSRQDLPWAVLIILTTGLISGFLWQLAQALFIPPSKSNEEVPMPREETPKDCPRR